VDNPWGMRVAIIYHPRAALADYYDADAAAARYAAAGVALDPAALRCRLATHVRALAKEDFASGGLELSEDSDDSDGCFKFKLPERFVLTRSLPMIGMCSGYGYAVRETLAVIANHGGPPED
jgi:hypothetical protein